MTKNTNRKPGSDQGTFSKKIVNPAVAHAPSISLTLMRKAVRKPAPSFKRQIKVAGDLSISQKSHIGHASVVSMKSISNQQQVSSTVKLNPLISRFPKSHSTHHFTRAKTKGNHPPEVSSTSRSATLRPIKTELQPSKDIFERAIHQSRSHHQAKPKAKRIYKRTSFATIALFALVISGVVFSQHLDSIKMQLAAAKAGFTPTLPTSMPSGFSMSKLSYTSGMVETAFRSNSNSSDYKIIQKSTDWNEGQLGKYVSQHYPGYTSIVGGISTVFLYNNHDATWVSQGIWYTVGSDGSLSNHELLQMAANT
jgi:hypothetical protein